MGTTALKYAQSRIETTWGTDTAATARFAALDDLGFTFDIANTQRTYLQGDLSPSHAVYQTQATGTAKLMGDFTFEDGMIYGDAAIQGTVSPSTVDTNARVYTFNGPTTAAPAPRSRTIEIYDGVTGYQLTGALIKTLKLSGSAGAGNLVRVESDWLGQTMTKATPTGALTNRSVTALPANLCKLYVDALGGTVGTTVKAATLIDWSWEYDSGLHLKMFQSGATAPTTYGYDKASVKLNVTLEMNSVGVAEVDAFIAGTGRLYQIEGISTVLAGAATKYKTLTIQVAGDITNAVNLYSDRDGNTTVQLEITGRYDGGAFANYTKLIVANALTAWPDV